MTIYFDENKEAYSQLETLERWGKSLLFQCSDEEYQEYLEGKRIWQLGKLVINPDYEAEQAEKERIAHIKEIKTQLVNWTRSASAQCASRQNMQKAFHGLNIITNRRNHYVQNFRKQKVAAYSCSLLSE